VPPAGTVPAGTDVVSGTHAAEIGELTARMRLIEKLGISTEPTAFFDAVATELATRTAFLYGFVNLVLTEQTFVGLHNPPAGSGHLTVRRTMGLDHGWCPEVVKRKKALPLADVHQSPRFTGNPVVDAVGIRSYFGAPLLHKPTGIVLGTVCVIDPEPRPQTDAVQLRDMVNEAADTVMAAVTGRATAR
jgi:GAF domain-containing protein